MINELKVSGAYLVKGFRKFSIWKGKRSPDITREHNLRIPPSQVRKLHSYCLKYCLNNSVSGKCFVTICYNQFWIMFFSNSPVILWLLLRHAPPCSASLSAQAAVMGRLPSRLQWQSVSGLPGCSAADGFQVAFSMFQHKKSRWNRLPMETMSHSSTCSLPATLMFFSQKNSQRFLE